MRAALISIKPLLIKWTIVYCAGVLLLPAFILFSAAKDKISGTYRSSKNYAGQPSRKAVEASALYKIMETPVQKAEPVAKSTKRWSSSSGNTYARGNCTWYAKHKRPDLPNNLGNANTWVSRARAQGLSTGSIPKAGAIAQKRMHVAYVERVNADGTIYISEMNYKGFGVISQRTMPASTFKYIY